MNFTHLHVHSHYSLLDGVAPIDKLVATAKQKGMTSLALTDHGNLHGAMEFVNECNSESIKPIVGCEFYLADNMRDNTSSKRYHQLLIAKNAEGYKNLIYLSTLSYKEGFYYKPRIDSETLFKNSKGLIATTSCLNGIIPRKIMENVDEARILFGKWKEVFGEDFYIELQRHSEPQELVNDLKKVNEVLIRFSKEFNVKMICTNDVHYCEKEDHLAQDVLICLQTGKNFDDPTRMNFSSSSFYMKSPEEMERAFFDYKEVVDNTQEIVSKVEKLNLKRDMMLPNFKIPENFKNQSEYLRYLVNENTRKLYSNFDSVVETRMNYELDMIEKMGFQGYFLIVMDFVKAAKDSGIWVGPGRGSAAGSLISYALGITNVDPIKYNLLFERFLNPERVSMPDIDIDFEDTERQKVIDYVIKKYGEEYASKIVTFSTMAAKSAIKDVARVINLPLADATRLAKYIPTTPGAKLIDAINNNSDLKKEYENGSELIKKTLKFALTLEGNVRQTGVHPAGVIISPEPIHKFIPLCKTKGDNIVTQFEGDLMEKNGMLKMDFLGLKTLSILKEAIKLIKNNKNIDINIDTIPIDDRASFELFHHGKTAGIFQFESDEMTEYLKELIPTNIEDLVAMNALYRPGPMKFIPDYIRCKHGKQKVIYPHPMLKKILENTFGIMIYQEQIMEVARVMGGYTLAGADILRRAMGKKKVDEMNKQKSIFVEGAKKNNVSEEDAVKVFEIMSDFANYGFNRSHSVAYSILAYKTAYVKVHYPAEFMCSLLTHNLDDIKKIGYYLSEAKKLGLIIKPPSINESGVYFEPKDNNVIVFGLSAIKGIGIEIISKIINDRDKNGNYKGIFEFLDRNNDKNISKKVLEALISAGALDDFKEFHRAQYLHLNTNGQKGIEIILNRVNKLNKKEKLEQVSLFGDEGSKIEDAEIRIEDCEPYSNINKLKKEKEIAGMYFSGHPLDDFLFATKFEGLIKIKDIEHINKLNIYKKVLGFIVKVEHRLTKTGKGFGTFEIEDYDDNYKFALFGERYLKFKHLLVENTPVFVKIVSRENYNQPGVIEIQVEEITLLDDILKHPTSINFSINSKTFNKETLELFKEFYNSKKGKCLVKIKIIDMDSSDNETYLFTAKKLITLEPDILNTFIKKDLKFSIKV